MIPEVSITGPPQPDPPATCISMSAGETAGNDKLLLHKSSTEAPFRIQRTNRTTSPTIVSAGSSHGEEEFICPRWEQRTSSCACKVPVTPWSVWSIFFQVPANLLHLSSKICNHLTHLEIATAYRVTKLLCATVRQIVLDHSGYPQRSNNEQHLYPQNKIWCMCYLKVKPCQAKTTETIKPI